MSETGKRNDEPATACLDRNGDYAVSNDNSGQIVQVSDKNDPGWIKTF